MKIAIVDDEKIIRKEMESFIRERTSDCSVDGYDTGEELLLAEKKYDIVFLDICMEGKNGIDIARSLRRNERPPVLIFVTAIKDYVFEAFDVAAFHYLLKPVDPLKFGEVLERAIREVEKREKTEVLFIKSGNRTVPLKKGGILYVESRGKKAEIHTDRETIAMYASLNGLEAELGAGFYRCHRGYLVNLGYVSEYHHDAILLTNGETIYMAKEKYQEFVREYMRYLKNGGVMHG